MTRTLPSGEARISPNHCVAVGSPRLSLPTRSSGVTVQVDIGESLEQIDRAIEVGGSLRAHDASDRLRKEDAPAGEQGIDQLRRGGVGADEAFAGVGRVWLGAQVTWLPTTLLSRGVAVRAGDHDPPPR